MRSRFYGFTRGVDVPALVFRHSNAIPSPLSRLQLCAAGLVLCELAYKRKAALRVKHSAAFGANPKEILASHLTCELAGQYLIARHLQALFALFAIFSRWSRKNALAGVLESGNGRIIRNVWRVSGEMPLKSHRVAR